jgi:hypothetical protein
MVLYFSLPQYAAPLNQTAVFKLLYKSIEIDFAKHNKDRKM